MLTRTDTVRDFVVKDFRTAAVFEKHGLDFCCGGGLPLEDACRKKGLDADAVQRDLAAVMATKNDAGPGPESWELDALANHIVATHHAFVRESLPALIQHSEKVARVHGDRHPEMVDVARHVTTLAHEMTQHMMKEELVLFPYIDALAEAARGEGSTPQAPFGTVSNPIQMMVEEHESAGDETGEIRRLTSNYTPPEDACTTYRVLFQELEAFEKDLHRHVHLENNILFPKAERLEGQLLGH
jgi:regulator of cell morphogenesis and NO signaling